MSQPAVIQGGPLLKFLRGRFGALSIAELAAKCSAPVEQMEHLVSLLKRNGTIRQVHLGLWLPTEPAATPGRLAWDSEKRCWNEAFDQLLPDERFEQILDRCLATPPLRQRRRPGRNRSLRIRST